MRATPTRAGSMEGRPPLRGSTMRQRHWNRWHGTPRHQRGSRARSTGRSGIGFSASGSSTSESVRNGRRQRSPSSAEAGGPQLSPPAATRTPIRSATARVLSGSAWAYTFMSMSGEWPRTSATARSSRTSWAPRTMCVAAVWRRPCDVRAVAARLPARAARAHGRGCEASPAGRRAWRQ